MVHQENTKLADRPVIERLPQTAPADEFNRELVRNVHPLDWANPKPSGRYDLVVIGAGTAGLVTAAGAAGLGAKVALIEHNLMGGDCLNVGCVPSKGVIGAARVAAAVRQSGAFGVEAPDGVKVDFAAVMQRMRRLRARISPNDSAVRFRDLGIDVYFGQARFVDSNTVDVDGTQLIFKRVVVATGARAAAPPIPGLDSADYLTNETLFSMTELPRRLGIIGAGPIGCEMAQALAQLGFEVFLVETTHGILPREDRDAAEIVQQAMTQSGVKLLCCGKELEIKHDKGIRLVVESHDQGYDEPIDKLLVSVGRAPNVENLNLEAVGVDYDKKGVMVNERMQTTNSGIYAAGDICSPFQFTHAADFMARIVIQNALFMGRKKSTSLVMPWCTYTSPEIAHVGLYENQADEQGIKIDTFVQELRDVDRAILDGEDEGFVKVHVKKGTDKIVGATIVAGRAGDMISEITLAMTHGLGLKQIGSTIHPYPTQAEAIRKLGDQYNPAGGSGRRQPQRFKPFDIGQPGPILMLVALLQVWSYPMHDPVMMDRGFLADRETTRRSFLHACWISFLCILVFGCLGVLAGANALSGEQMNDTLMRLLGAVPMLVFNACLVISAMSTLDSTLSSSAKLIAADMGVMKMNIRNGRMVMAVFMILGLLLVFWGNKDLFSATAVSGTASMYLAPVIFFSLWGKRTDIPTWSFVVSFLVALAGAALYFTESSGHSAWLGEIHKYTKLLAICVTVLGSGCLSFWLGGLFNRSGKVEEAR